MYGIGRSRREKPRPAWKALYAAVTLALALFALAEIIVPQGAARVAAEIAAAAIVVGTMALWVRVNRIALEFHGRRNCGWRGAAVDAVVADEPAEWRHRDRTPQRVGTAVHQGRAARREATHPDRMALATRG
jgi:hypothetical protein